MASSKSGQDRDTPVSLKRKDAYRVADVVKWYEREPRIRKPSRLPRSTGSSDGSVRIGRFTGAWPSEPGASKVANVKTVELMTSIPGIQGTDTGGTSTSVSVINLFSYIPARVGGTGYLWCAVVKKGDRWILLAAEC